MYNSQKTVCRIKRRAKEQGIAVLDLQAKCDLGRNALSQAAKSQDGMKARNLFAIAEILDCSVDYLLGRTDNPNISGNYINGDNNVQAIRTGNGDITIHAEKQLTKETDLTTEEFIKIFCNLDFDDKFEVMQLLMQKRGGKNDHFLYSYFCTSFHHRYIEIFCRGFK